MNITLVFPPFFLEPMYNLPPLGLVNLATAIKDLPHSVSVLDLVLAIRTGELALDAGIYDACADRILGREPDVVAFSAQCTTYPAVIQICRRLKRRAPAVRTVLGGHNPAFVDEETLRAFPEVDAIVRGEGEVTFRRLMEDYAAGGVGAGVAGVTWREGRHIRCNPDRELLADLNELPYPDYSFVPSLDVYRRACNLPRSIAILEAGRGCPHKCVYCSEALLWQGRTRTYSVERLVAEMEKVHRQFGAECFLLAYDQFTARRAFVEDFCRLVMERGLSHIPWYCISRLDSVDRELLDLMRAAGCESMCYGIDSGSRKTLAFIRKRIDLGILYDRVQATAEAGIIPTLSFVIGFPEERKEDIDATLVLALRAGITGNNNPLIQLPTVLPGTELHERYAAGLVREVDTYFALGLEFDNGRRLDEDEVLIDSDPFIFSSFYNLPTPARSLEELNLIAAYFPLVVRLLPKTFLLLACELRASISDLFMEWLRWLAQSAGREALGLTPQDCYRHFPGFFDHKLAPGGALRLGHLRDVFRYEMLSLEAGKHAASRSLFNVELNRSEPARPVADKKIIVGEFDFNLPMIIIDLKSGVFEKSYTPEKSILAFRQEDDLLEVMELNAFGRDFLELCDGSLNLGSIARQLKGRYGPDLPESEFEAVCRTALQTLVDSGFIAAGS